MKDQSFTLKDFKKMLGAEAISMSDKEIEVFYNTSIGLFNILFDKWKKEKTKVK